jgi:hypothetical protein
MHVFCMHQGVLHVRSKCGECKWGLVVRRPNEWGLVSVAAWGVIPCII